MGWVTRRVLRVIGADFLGARGDHETLVDQFLIESKVKILIYLPVVDEAQIAMLAQEARPDAVDGVDGAALELVEVAGDHFGARFKVGDQNRDLVLLAQLAKGLPGPMSHLEVPIRAIFTAKFANNSIEVEYEQVLVLEALSPLEQDALCHEGVFGGASWHLLLSEALLVELDLPSGELHLSVLVELVLTCLLFDYATLL